MAMLDRQLRFGRVAAVEAADTLGFNAFALTAAIAGLGVFSLAGAVPFGAMLGAVVAWVTPEIGHRPRLDIARVKPLIGFGSRVSALGVLYLGRDLAYVAVVGAVGGAAMAGFYGMAKRLFSFPIALAAAVSRVMLPALSQSGSERPARAARMLGQIALVCGLPLALVAGAIQPLIVVVLGREWLPAADIVLFGSLSMLLAASINSPINSYRLAEGKPNSPVAAIAAELLIGVPLLAVATGAIEESGIGIAMSVGSMVSAGILLGTGGSQIRGGLGRVARVTLVSAAAATLGQLLPVGEDAAGLVISLTAIAACWLILAFFLLNEELVRVFGIMRRMRPRSRSA
jgi:O-antigen/teichoic acid export membrane protein